MNEQASTLFNISFSFSGESARKVELSSLPLYRRLVQIAMPCSLYRLERLEVVGRQLAAVARQAYFARQMETVEQASQLMLAMPLSKELKSVAKYYQAICIKRKGDFKGARQLLERVVSEATSPFRAKVLLSIGATYFDDGEVESAAPYYPNAASVAGEDDLYTFVMAQKMTAVVRSIYGDHQQALADLERLFP